MNPTLREVILKLVPTDGSTIGNSRLRAAVIQVLGREVDEAEYAAGRDELVNDGLLVKGQGRGGSVRRSEAAVKDSPTPGSVTYLFGAAGPPAGQEAGSAPRKPSGNTSKAASRGRVKTGQWREVFAT